MRRELQSSESESEVECESEVDSDDHLLSTLAETEISDLRVQDISLDPKLDVSDHEDDLELATQGYGSCDTDEEEQCDDSTDNRKVEKTADSWCHCGNCCVMASEIECYCCRESNHITELILDVEKVNCVTDCELFVNSISNLKMLQMYSFGLLQKKVALDKDGKIKPEGLRYAAYRMFLNICELRFIGKNRRYVLPACVIAKIRLLYPSDDGSYKAFQAAEFSSKI